MKEIYSAVVRLMHPALLWVYGLLIISFFSAARCDTYIVSPNGSDANPGTISSPWRTLARASSGLRPGDSVLVRAGRYQEHFQPENSGSPGAQIVYKAFPGERPEITGAPDGRINVVTVWAHHVTIEGFLVTNQDYFRVLGDATYWVALEGNYLEFRNNHVIAYGDVWDNIYVKNAISRGIVVAGNHSIVEHCYVRGQVFGIVIAGPSPRHVIIRYDTVHATGQNNINVTSTSGGETAYHATLIEHCQLDTSFIEDNIQFEVDYNDPTSTLHNRGTIVRHNVMGNAIENAIDLKGAGHTIIEHNLIYSSSGDDDGPIGGNDTRSGGGITSNPNNPTRNTVIRYNVIWDHSTGMEMAEGDRYFNNTILNNRRTWRGPNQIEDIHTAIRAWNYPDVERALINNIICDMPTGSIYNFLMDWGARFTLDNNLYFENTGEVSFFHRMLGQMHVTRGLANWQAELRTFGGYAYIKGKDQQSIEADPQFVNVPRYPVGYEAAWDFRLLQTSPAVDAGRSVAFTTSAGSNSTALEVSDAFFFCDGFGVADGDLIKIGSSAAVRIASINYSTNLITLREPRNWSPGEGVHLDYWGSNPDIGAVEFVGGLPPPLPTPPVLTSPAPGAIGLGLNVVLIWDRGNGAASYDLQLATSASMETPVIEKSGLTGLSYTVRNLLEDTRYYWRIRSANGIGFSAWSEVRSFSTMRLDSLPMPPTAQTPEDGAIGVSTNPQFRWTMIGDAISYRLQVSRNPDFLEPVVDRQELAETTAVIDDLLLDTKYHWRVSASSAKGEGPWSLVSTLTTFSLPPSLGENVLGNGAFTNGTSEWSFFTNGAATFAVAGPGFRKPTSGKIFITQPGTNTQLFQSNLVLSPDSTYRLSFAAFSTTGNDLEVSVHKGVPPYTPYGLNGVRVDLTAGWNVFVLPFAPENFTSPVNDVRLRFSFDAYGRAGDIYSLDNVRFQAVNALTPPPPETLPVDFSLEQNFPNPFNPFTTIRYAIPIDTRVRLDVVNILGQQVLSLVDAFQKVGSYDIRVDMSRFASGVYFYTLTADAFRQTRKLLLIK